MYSGSHTLSNAKQRHFEIQSHTGKLLKRNAYDYGPRREFVKDTMAKARNVNLCYWSETLEHNLKYACCITCKQVLVDICKNVGKSVDL